MKLLMLAGLMLSGTSALSAVPSLTRIHDESVGATALVNGIALLADYNELGLKAASITGVVQLVDVGNVRRFRCNANTCFFGVNQNSGTGKLWRSDGTPGGTRIVADFPDGGITVIALVGEIAYVQVGGSNGRIAEVDASGSVRIIYSGYANGDFVANEQVAAFSTNNNLGRIIRIDRGSTPVDLGRYALNAERPVGVVGDTLIFAMETPATGTELFKHQRGDSAPVLIREFSPGPTGSGPSMITQYGDGFYFQTGIGVFSLAPPFTNPVPVTGFRLSFRMEPKFGRLAIAGSGGGFQNAFLINSFGGQAVSLSSFTAGRFDDSEKEVFGFLESGVVYGANATVTGPNSISKGREPYYSDYSGGPAILLADLAPGASDSLPRAMSSDGERAVFSAAGAVWLAGQPLGGPLSLPQPVPLDTYAGSLMMMLLLLVVGCLYVRAHQCGFPLIR